MNPAHFFSLSLVVVVAAAALPLHLFASEHFACRMTAQNDCVFYVFYRDVIISMEIGEHMKFFALSLCLCCVQCTRSRLVASAAAVAAAATVALCSET